MKAFAVIGYTTLILLEFTMIPEIAHAQFMNPIFIHFRWNSMEDNCNKFFGGSLGLVQKAKLPSKVVAEICLWRKKRRKLLICSGR